MLAEFKVTIKYIQGSHNLRADFLSRLRHDPAEDMPMISLIDAKVEKDYPLPWLADEPGSLELLRFDGIPTKDLIVEQQKENSMQDKTIKWVLEA